jgi:hypothetical protein
MEPKFKIGDVVVCKAYDKIPLYQFGPGVGYIPEMKFTIRKIDNLSSSETVYWPTREDTAHCERGVYEYALDLWEPTIQDEEQKIIKEIWTSK